RRASSELKATLDREMKHLEQETESIKEAANQYQSETYSYDYSHHDSSYEGAYGYDGTYGHENHDSTATNPSTVSASAPQDAEHHAGAPEGTVAHGTQPAQAGNTQAHDTHREPDPNAAPAPTAPHNA